VDASHTRHKLCGFSEDDGVGCRLLLIIIRLQQLRLKVTRVLFLLRFDNRLARARQSFSDIVAVVIVDILGRGRGRRCY
jgi:hypothetical protein